MRQCCLFGSAGSVEKCVRRGDFTMWMDPPSFFDRAPVIIIVSRWGVNIVRLHLSYRLLAPLTTIIAQRNGREDCGRCDRFSHPQNFHHPRLSPQITRNFGNCFRMGLRWLLEGEFVDLYYVHGHDEQRLPGHRHSTRPHRFPVIIDSHASRNWILYFGRNSGIIDWESGGFGRAGRNGFLQCWFEKKLVFGHFIVRVELKRIV